MEPPCCDVSDCLNPICRRQNVPLVSSSLTHNVRVFRSLTKTPATFEPHRAFCLGKSQQIMDCLDHEASCGRLQCSTLQEHRDGRREGDCQQASGRMKRSSLKSNSKRKYEPKQIGYSVCKTKSAFSSSVDIPPGFDGYELDPASG